MNYVNVINELHKKYPGNAIFPNDPNNPSEILCEINPSTEHPDYSNAIAVIDKSEPHIHFKSTEVYKVIKGELTLHVEDKAIKLKEGESYEIEPGNVHWGEGTETWIECYSKPGWTFEDHLAVTYIETLAVTEGVKCDVYRFVNNISKDLGIIKIEPGKKTPLQRVLKGDKTIEGYISGTGKLEITKTAGTKSTYWAEKGFEISVNIGETMQWIADTDSTLEAYEICYPPYEDGRYENLN